jgi:hypothetical protein
MSATQAGFSTENSCAQTFTTTDDVLETFSQFFIGLRDRFALSIQVDEIWLTNAFSKKYAHAVARNTRMYPA